jgi:hypothetical protein
MAGGTRFRTLAAAILAPGALALAAASPVSTNPVKLRAGHSAAQAFSLMPVELGPRESIFAKDAGAVDMTKLSTEAYLPKE